MKYRELTKLFKVDGWYVDHATGSHLQFRHPTKPVTVTVASGGKQGRDEPPGTLNSVIKQAGLK